jgi:hypothetical protein
VWLNLYRCFASVGKGVVAQLVWMCWINLYRYFSSVGKDVVAQLVCLCGSICIGVLPLLVRVWWLTWYGCAGSTVMMRCLSTVKEARGKVSFDSLNVKCTSKLSCCASLGAYLSHLISKMTNTLFNFLSYK